MKNMPLSAKVALWSLLLAALTMGSALVVMSRVLEQELVAGVDQRLERIAKDVFVELDRRSAEPPTTVTREMMPRSVGTLPVEVLGADGTLLYRSAGLKQLTLQGGPDAPRKMMLGKAAYRVIPRKQRGLTVLIGYPLRGTELSMERVRTASYVALPVAALFSLVGGYWVAGRALRPVRKITEAAARITAEDLHQRLPVPAARDEIRLLTNVLNDTFNRLERSYQQAVRFASDASHQLKTPVTVMRAAIESLLADASLRPEQNAVLNDLLDQTRRLSSLTEGLLLLARADAGGIVAQPSEADLIPILDRCIEDAEVLGSNQQIRIERDLPPDLFALADPQRTEQILLNLLENAVKYNRQGGVIRVRAGERRDGIFIAVANSGQSIPPERMPWIFDRFSRGNRDESRAGHGLGLSIARELAAAQGGDVRLLHSDENMTEFELRLVPPGGKTSDNPLIPLLTPPPTRVALPNRA
ncbi:MAG: ATP-binding protein [Chthoniobacteraceae bacterium]